MSASATPSPSSVPAVPALTQVQRLAFTFTAPSRTMADISRSASWWLPWIVISIVSLLLAFAIGSKVTWKSVVENLIDQNPKMADTLAKMPAQQRALTTTVYTIAYKGAMYASPALNLLYYVIIAGILLGLFNFGFGAELKFGRAFAITIYSSLVSGIKALLVIILLFAGMDPASFNLRNPIASNLASFLPPDANRALYAVASTFDVFVLWMLFLMAVGISRNSKVKTRTAFIAIFLLYFVVIGGLGALGAA